MGQPVPGGSVLIEVELDGIHHIFDDYVGDRPVLEFLEDKGLSVPYSCRQGHCATCVCVLLAGEVKMVNNEILDSEDLADGLRLTCQSFPLTEKLQITYDAV